MQIGSDNLNKFIEDFNLTETEGILCFEATISYTTTRKHIQIPSEVHIIHLSKTCLNIINLLDPDIVKHGLPSTIEDVSTVDYRANEFLYIRGYSADDGEYILSIHPVGAACEPETLKELHGKTYN